MDLSPLFAYDANALSSPTVLVVLACVAAFFVGVWLFRKDEKIEDRRRNAAQLAAKLTSLGMKDLPEVLIAYSVGDYSGFVQQLKALHGKLQDPDEKRAALKRMTLGLAKTMLEDEEGRKYLLDLVDEWKAAYAAKQEKLVVEAGYEISQE